MKKNITINLLGRLYAIDEDAYELLKRYTDSLRSYFARREGGEEIADDIEARIAELFDELKQGGLQAITIEHVEDIIHRVGRPEDMEEEDLSQDPSRPPHEGEEKPQSEEDGEAPSLTGGRGEGRHRRLYRNLADRKLMGVLSGLAAYFGGDVLWWRLGYVALFFLPGGFVSRMFYWSSWHWGISLNFTLIILYVALGILMPVAETPEDRLRMKGKPVNPQNLADEVSQPQPDNVPGDGPKGCINGIFLMLGNLFRGFIYIMGVMLAVGLLVAIVALLAITLMPHSLIHESDPEFWQFIDSNRHLLSMASVAALIVLAIPAYCIIHSLFHEFGKLQPMGFRQRVSFLVVWLVALVTAAVIGTGLVGKLTVIEETLREIRDGQYRKENTHDGIFYDPDEWEFLSERGWRVVRAEHCNDRYTSSGEYYTDDYSRYIDTYDGRHRQLFTIERTDELQPGRYQLSACVRANGQGAYVYAYTDSLSSYLAEIPACGNTGGGIWREAKEKCDSIDAYVTPNPESVRPDDYDYLRAIAEANDGRGFGWNRIALPLIVVKKPSLLHYGVSTVPSLTGHTWLGQWFSACDFELKRIDEKQK